MQLVSGHERGTLGGWAAIVIRWGMFVSVSRWIGRFIGLVCLVLAATAALAETIISPETQGQLGFENGVLVVRPDAPAADPLGPSANTVARDCDRGRCSTSTNSPPS